MLLLLAFTASADVGPPPTCPAGQHNEYLRGNHCVKDGFHLEEGPDGNPIEVADPTPQPAPTPEAGQGGTPINPAPPPPEKRCATAPGTLGLGLLLALAAAASRRRR